MEGVKVYVHNTVPHKSSRSKQWQRQLLRLGAELLEKPSSAATHLLTSSYTDLSADRQGMPHAQVVSVAWLETCMSAQTRVSESSYILEPSGAQSQPGPSSNGKQVQPSLELQAKHAIQLMDIQKAVLYLTAGEPAPQWLAVKIDTHPQSVSLSSKSAARPSKSAMTVPCVAQPCDARQPSLRTEHKRERSLTRRRRRIILQ